MSCAACDLPKTNFVHWNCNLKAQQSATCNKAQPRFDLFRSFVSQLRFGLNTAHSHALRRLVGGACEVGEDGFFFG